MNTDPFIALLCVATGAFAVLTIGYYFTAEYHHARATRLIAERDQQAANAQAQKHRANLHRKALEQAQDRINLLVAHNAELEEEKRSLENHNFHLLGEIQRTNRDTLQRIAFADGQTRLVPSNPINLN
jgi:hypothetical protein